MANIITYEDNEQQIIGLCKRIRQFAKLDRIKLDTSEHQDNRNTHLFKYLDYCGVSKEDFVKSYLTNLQPFMLSEFKEQEKATNTICVLDNIYRVSLYIKIDTTFGKEMVVSFHENHKRGVARDNSRFIKDKSDKVKVLADSITGGITNTNTKTFDILIPRGVVNIPVSLVGELQTDGTFLVNKSAIDNAVLDVCNQYIRDLYASDLDLPALDEVEIFSALQQISFTSYGNSVFSNISLLIDNMSAQNSPLHKTSAAFALETYTEHLKLTVEQKKELVELITDKYRVSYQKDIDKVTNMLIDIINSIEPERLIVDGQTNNQDNTETTDFPDEDGPFPVPTPRI